VLEGELRPSEGVITGVGVMQGLRVGRTTVACAVCVCGGGGGMADHGVCMPETAAGAPCMRAAHMGWHSTTKTQRFRPLSQRRRGKTNESKGTTTVNSQLNRMQMDLRVRVSSDVPGWHVDSSLETFFFSRDQFSSGLGKNENPVAEAKTTTQHNALWGAVVLRRNQVRCVLVALRIGCVCEI
jgi:hypothetical protein